MTEFVRWVDYPIARIRFELDTERGRPIRFVVQLERRVDAEWRAVARFDHDERGETAHDVTEEGLHMDVYSDGRTVRVLRGFPPVAFTDAPRYCRAYLETHADRLLRRFDEWHDPKRQ